VAAAPHARWGRPIRLAVLFLVVVAPWVKELTVQPAARLALTAAVVDEGTIRIDRYEGIVGIDRVERDGHLYSDKAPGQPFLAVPAYWSARLVGAEDASVPRGEGNLTLWWVTLWSSTVPGAVVVGVLAHRALRGRAAGLVAAAGIGFATLWLPFSAELYGHVLVAALGLATWLLVERATSPARLVAAGLLAGLTVLVEYQMILLVVVLAGYVLVRRGARRVAAFAAGGVPVAVLLLAYQAAAFGGPLRTSYGEKPVHDEGGATIVGIPSPVQAVEVLFGSRGLVLFTPVVAIALYGLVVRARGAANGERDEARVGLAVFVVFLALQAGWPNPWGGEMPGPRYIIPALPFLAPGLQEGWVRLVGAARQPLGRLVAWGALVWSVVAMSLPLITLHLVPAGGATVRSHLDNLDRFGVSPTVWTLAFGGLGWVIHGASVAGAVWWLRSADRSR
jgi:hypothetical protein